jgi:hypothetical protein
MIAVGFRDFNVSLTRKGPLARLSAFYCLFSAIFCRNLPTAARSGSYLFTFVCTNLSTNEATSNLYRPTRVPGPVRVSTAVPSVLLVVQDKLHRPLLEIASQGLGPKDTNC